MKIIGEKQDTKMPYEIYFARHCKPLLITTAHRDEFFLFCTRQIMIATVQNKPAGNHNYGLGSTVCLEIYAIKVKVKCLSPILEK